MTANKAAAEVRSKIVRKVRAIERKYSHLQINRGWTELKAYLYGMAKRASAKRGGLGRK